MELRCGLCFAPHVDHLQSSRIEGQSGFMRCACNEHGSGLNLVYPPSHAQATARRQEGEKPQGCKPKVALK